uniref:Uncharacterized protein n=1 Tax=Chromera velia CCMP2878 TaxID=1169474 RepID=A0A0G4FJN4_9ALVE|eukprot:Cvel_17220.t1-p1 / transcript=Cvel_17220.t1 / gene=Cvel_17220 / organism=Chromera_velia_CCMP2878 / gene_product=hypothetical protein / transcript_product=hypothetical protein / location=Cvel_scaffold1362:47855-49063(+) / protein_length=403 / sequence_SO=supercontig / SO=protein_coding / is_pseudo=false
MRRISVPLGGHVSPDTGGRLRVALPSRCPCGAVSQRPVARRRSPLAKQRRGFPSSSASCSQAAVSPMSRLTALHEQWKRERLQETASGGRKETGTDPSERGETAPRFFSTSASDLSRASDESDSFSLEHFERRGLRASPEREPWHLSQSALQKLSAKILFLNMWMDQRRSRNRTRRKSLEGGEEDRDGDRDGALQSASCRSPVEGGVVPADLSAQEERRVLEALTHSARELSVQTPVRFVVLLSQVANTRVNPRRVESAELHGRMLESIFSSVTDGSRRAVGGEGTRSVFESLSTQDRLSLCRTLLSVLSKRHLEEKPPSEAEIAALSAIMDSFVQSLKKERKGEKGGVESSSASSVTSLALLCALAARVESRYVDVEGRSGLGRSIGRSVGGWVGSFVLSTQ